MKLLGKHVGYACALKTVGIGYFNRHFQPYQYNCQAITTKDTANSPKYSVEITEDSFESYQILLEWDEIVGVLRNSWI